MEMSEQPENYQEGSKFLTEQQQDNIIKHAIYDGRSYKTSCPAGCGRCCTDGTLFSCCCYLILIIVLLLGIGGFLTVCILFVHPYLSVSGFETTVCEINSTVFDIPGGSACSCGKHCTSGYPCVKIMVTHTLSPGSLAQLYDDEFKLKDDLCAFSDSMATCSKSREFNKDDVKRMEQGVQIGKSFSCMVDPDKPNEAIEQITFSSTLAMHLLLWPAIFILIIMCCIIGLYVCFKCMCCKIIGNRFRRAIQDDENMTFVPWGL